MSKHTPYNDPPIKFSNAEAADGITHVSTGMADAWTRFQVALLIATSTGKPIAGTDAYATMREMLCDYIPLCPDKAAYYVDEYLHEINPSTSIKDMLRWIDVTRMCIVVEQTARVQVPVQQKKGNYILNTFGGRNDA